MNSSKENKNHTASVFITVVRYSTVTLYQPCLHQEFVAKLKTCYKFPITLILPHNWPGFEERMEHTSRFLCRLNY